MNKSDIRKLIAARRPDFQTLEKLSAKIVQKFQCLENKMGGGSASFQGLELFQRAKTVGAYMPLPDEVDITPLFEFGSAGGVALPINFEQIGGANSPSEPPTLREKTFYIPAFDEASGIYRLAEYSADLKKGKFGILEPASPVFAPEEIDLILVPGVAFDLTGNRIGRGGGFYDHLLPQYRAVRAGICFDFQWLEKIPSEPHDCKMDFVVTESRIS